MEAEGQLIKVSSAERLSSCSAGSHLPQADLLDDVDADLDGLFSGLDMSSEAWSMMFHNADLMLPRDFELAGQISLGAESTVEKVSFLCIQHEPVPYLRMFVDPVLSSSCQAIM